MNDEGKNCIPRGSSLPVQDDCWLGLDRAKAIGSGLLSSNLYREKPITSGKVGKFKPIGPTDRCFSVYFWPILAGFGSHPHYSRIDEAKSDGHVDG